MNTRRPPLCVDVIGPQPEVVAVAAARLASLGAALTVRPGAAPAQLDPLADLIVIATGATPLDALPLIARLRRDEAPIPLVVLSELDDDSALLAVLRQGANGYLLTETSDAELGVAAQRLATGQAIVDPTMAGRILTQIAQGTWRSVTARRDWILTPRERQVLDSLAEGRTNRQIAQDLNLGQETVKTYLRSAYRKLGARDRTHAMAIILGGQPP